MIPYVYGMSWVSNLGSTCLYNFGSKQFAISERNPLGGEFFFHNWSNIVKEVNIFSNLNHSTYKQFHSVMYLIIYLKNLLIIPRNARALLSNRKNKNYLQIKWVDLFRYHNENSQYIISTRCTVMLIIWRTIILLLCVAYTLA